MNNSKKAIVNGIIWNGLQLLVNQSFSFVIRLILARILFPEQFGIIGMATVFTGLVQVINDIGISASLIQRKDEFLREAHFHTAFWTGIIWSVVIYIVILLSSPIIASFYNEPILSRLIPVISLGILSGPINLVHKAQLTKQMNFKKMAFIDNTSNIVAGCLALILAYNGAGVWSLAFNSVASILIAMPLYFNATKWYPKLIWEDNAFREIFGFGIYTTGTNIVNYLIGNVDYLLIGKLLSAELLGAYTLAFILTDTFRNRLTTIMNNVLYPIYGRNQDNLGAVKRYYLKVVEYNSIIVYPFMIFFIILGTPFIEFTFGAKWLNSVAPLKILAGSVIFSMMVNSNTVLIRGLGFPKLELQLQIIKAVIFIPSLILGIYYWGVLGASWAVLLNKIFAVILAQYTFNNLLKIKITTIEFCQALKKPFLASVLATIVAYTVNFLPVHFLLTGFSIFLTYSLVIWHYMSAEILDTIKNIKNKKGNAVIGS